MQKETKVFFKQQLGINSPLLQLAENMEQQLREAFVAIEQMREYNQLKVIHAMQLHHLSDTHFHGTTGYGYDDKGRDVLEEIYANVFGCEDALVRHQFVSGTHAIAVALAGNLQPGDEILAVTGKPYDTLDAVIGLSGDAFGSLKNQGIQYRQVELLSNGDPDIAGILSAIRDNTRIIFIQRSKGYSARRSLGITDIKTITTAVKGAHPDKIILVDNCYGEFVDSLEPSQVGADLIAGSLIKNPGGGLAPSGGYIAGKKNYVQRAAERLTSPGIGKKVGPTLGLNRTFFQGLFLAPHVVAESLKGAIFCGAIMQHLGFKIQPDIGEARSDIIQAIEFGNERALILFCQGIQKGSPVDSFVSPEPWSMPGYDDPVIMAAGGFIQGASIELSADAPIKPPYIAYMQGGLVYESVKLGVLKAVQNMIEEGICSF